MSLRFLALVSTSLALVLTGCITHIKSRVGQNPAPAEKFANFSSIEIAPISLEPPYAGQDANEKALRKIQDNVNLRTRPLLNEWNAHATEPGARTLLVQPRVTEIKFINGSARVWATWMAGSSAVILRVDFIDKATGQRIAQPEFYARAAAMSGAFSFGAADNVMLIRIATRFTDYLKANYSQAVGGPSGAEPEKS